MKNLVKLLEDYKLRLENDTEAPESIIHISPEEQDNALPFTIFVTNPGDLAHTSLLGIQVDEPTW